MTIKMPDFIKIGVSVYNHIVSVESALLLKKFIFYTARFVLRPRLGVVSGFPSFSIDLASGSGSVTRLDQGKILLSKFSLPEMTTGFLFTRLLIFINRDSISIQILSISLWELEISLFSLVQFDWQLSNEKVEFQRWIQAFDGFPNKYN